jgi:hypothetical protein
MTTAYSSLLGLALPVQGELAGQWGDTVNDYITKYLDASIAGSLSITADVTLTKTTGSALGATSSQYAILTCSPASVNIVVTAPAAYKIYVVNNTSASYTVTIRGAGPTSGVVLAALEKAVVAWNGSDFFKVATSATDGVSTFSAGSTGLTPNSATAGAVTLAGTLAVANGGTGLTAGTSGGVLAYTAAGTLASSSALAASALVIGGGAGAAPSTTTTGTGVVTALGVNVGTAGAFVVNGGALGTPTSGTVTNLTGTASININGTVGATTPATGTFTTLSATSLTVAKSISWTQSTDTYSGSGASDINTSMRRCLLRDDGSVNYYLDPTNSALKADGTSSVLTGADGMVMVEIPAFYVKFIAGTTRTWSISLFPASGYTLHPAFMKDGEYVPYRYIGAYDACVNSTGSTYESGLNYDDNWTSGQSWSTDATPKLASVSGIYPAIGITRANTRTLAANRGTGWRQVDVYLAWAVELLFLVEYGTFRTQQNIGDGNVSVSTGYPAASGNQTDSPHSVAGKSNSIGNASTNTSTGASNGTRDTAFMSYRGIENWYGNCFNWVDGYNINSNQAYVSNTRANFADDTATNYVAVGAAMVSSDGYVTDCQQEPFAFLPSAVGGSSSTYWADYYYQNSGWRVAFFGGNADSGARAGGFYWVLEDASSALARSVGARLAF